MDGLPIGSAPDETKYWFEEALICLVPRLDYPGILEKAVVDAIEYGRANCTKNSFNAVLISIEHLVLIKSLPDGIVDHTELMPLIPISPHVSKESRARYGDQAIDSFYDAMFTTNRQEVKEPDNMDLEQLSQHSDQQDNNNHPDRDGSKDAGSEDQDHEEEVKENGSDDDHAEAKKGAEEVEEAEENSETTDDSEEDAEMADEGTEHEVPPVQPPKSTVTGASIKTSFMALVQFFEAMTLETLRSTQPNEARVPEEICEMVLRYVSDVNTYNSCLKVSRRFRLLCQRRPLIMDNIVFLEPLRENTDSAIRKSEGRSTQHTPPPDFLAVEVSSDRQMNVHLSSYYGRDDDPAVTCFVVAGHEYNRKTYLANCQLIFSGLCITAPTAGERKTRFSLGRFWEKATKAIEHPVKKTVEPDWTLPPNTLCYFGTQQSFTESGTNELKFFHYSYLRVKRASKYYDNLWENIILEATEHLNHTDDQYIRYGDCPEGQVVGADNPHVLLAVGTEVRLFRWEQGFDDSVDDDARRKKSPSSLLRELHPGTTLRVCERADREEIERFFDAAEQHRQMIETQESEKVGGKKRWYIF